MEEKIRTPQNGSPIPVLHHFAPHDFTKYIPCEHADFVRLFSSSAQAKMRPLILILSALDAAHRCHRFGRARQREWRTAVPAVTPNRRPACCGDVKHRPHLEYLPTTGGTPKTVRLAWRTAVPAVRENGRPACFLVTMYLQGEIHPRSMSLSEQYQAGRLSALTAGTAVFHMFPVSPLSRHLRSQFLILFFSAFQLSPLRSASRPKLTRDHLTNHAAISPLRHRPTCRRLSEQQPLPTSNLYPIMRPSQPTAFAMP